MPELYKNKYKITSNRLQGYDYGSEGAYFITLNTANHIYEFGNISNGEMILNDNGKIIYDQWQKTSEMRKNIHLGEYIVMPNHFHAVVFIGNPVISESNIKIFQSSDHQNKFGPQKNNLASIIAGFKAACTKQITIKGNKSFAWQRNYYDHIIRNQKELINIENYIRNNPFNWVKDKFHNKN